jgi:hypothetical protein
MPFGGVLGHYTAAAPSGRGAWSGTDPNLDQEEEMRLALMEEQRRGMQQDRVMKWEADRAATIRPYDSMPMERMVLDQNSPLYRWSGSAPENAGIQMEMEPSAGAWAGSAPERLAAPDMGQRVPVPQSQWDAAMGRSAPGMTAADRLRHDQIVSITDELGNLSKQVDLQGNLTPTALARTNTLRGQLDSLRGGASTAAPTPPPTPTATATGGNLAGAVGAPTQPPIDNRSMEERYPGMQPYTPDIQSPFHGMVPQSMGDLGDMAFSSLGTKIPAGAVRDGASPERFSPEAEKTIQDNVNAYGKSREEVIAALRAKKVIP